MPDKFRAYATKSAGAKLERYDFDPGPLGDDQVEIAVDYCGLCHSDLSFIKNEWGMTAYPFVPGHEVAGKIVAVGQHVMDRKVGQTVGLGWYSRSCAHCPQCMTGNQNLCPTVEGTIVHRPGGFADRVRCQWMWATPLPAGMDLAKAGPMFCAGVTVFNPMVQFDVKPTDRVGVIGIGGLGHLALQFFNKWGCHVTAFSSNPSKQDEIKKLGAHDICDLKNPDQIKRIAGSLNFLLDTANATLNWAGIFESLAPKGRLHVVGAVPEPIPVSIFYLLTTQRSLSSSPLGSPATTASMLDFAARHNVAPIIETYPMSKVNEAVERLESGKARYRIVLKNDLA
jgi:alcohol/geraniol dehydrogenase (NADP+)